jgi:hypothetical protein
LRSSEDNRTDILPEGIRRALANNDGSGTVFYDARRRALIANGVVIGHAVSGNGSGLNNPDKARQRNTGPVPPGYYSLGEPHYHGYKTRSGVIQKYSIEVIPPPGDVGAKQMRATDGGQRDGIFIHENLRLATGPGSQGCIAFYQAGTVVDLAKFFQKAGINRLVVFDSEKLPNKQFDRLAVLKQLNVPFNVADRRFEAEQKQLLAARENQNRTASLDAKQIFPNAATAATAPAPQEGGVWNAIKRGFTNVMRLQGEAALAQSEAYGALFGVKKVQTPNGAVVQTTAVAPTNNAPRVAAGAAVTPVRSGPTQTEIDWYKKNRDRTRDLQRTLNGLGANVDTTGRFDRNTEEALKRHYPTIAARQAPQAVVPAPAAAPAAAQTRVTSAGTPRGIPAMVRPPLNN